MPCRWAHELIPELLRKQGLDPTQRQHRLALLNALEPVIEKLQLVSTAQLQEYYAKNATE